MESDRKRSDDMEEKPFFILIQNYIYFDPLFLFSLWFYLCLFKHKLFIFTAHIDKAF